MDGFNLYEYVGTGPLQYTDPGGHNRGPCWVKQISGPDGDGSFGPNATRKRDIFRYSHTIVTTGPNGKVKHKVGHTWISCGETSYGFYPETYLEALLIGRTNSVIPGMYGSDPSVKKPEQDLPSDPLEGKPGRPIEPDWIWMTDVPERPSGPPQSRLAAGSGKGTLCCNATDTQIKDCVDTVAREDWKGTQWRLDRHCQDMVVDILKKCCMTAEWKDRVETRARLQQPGTGD